MLIVFSDFQVSHIQQESLAFNTIQKYYDKPKEHSLSKFAKFSEKPTFLTS